MANTNCFILVLLKFGFTWFHNDQSLHPPSRSTEERRALVEYIALFTHLAKNKPSWPALKTLCTEAVSCTSGKPKRSGKE